MELKTYTQLNKEYHQSFGTRIRVVSPKFFNYVKNKMKNKHFAHINEWCLKPLSTYVENLPYDKYEHVSYYSGYCLNQKNILTKGVKSCSAGVIVKKGDNSSIFFHVFNSKKEKDRIYKIAPFMQGDNAILIGAKEICSQSLAVFDRFKKVIKDKQIPLTYFKDQAKSSSVDMAYFSEFDTLYLSIKDLANKGQYVKNIDDLRNVFQKIHISPIDNIKFISPIYELIEKIRISSL